MPQKRKSRILLTGATGFIGKQVLSLLQKGNKWSVRLLVRDVMKIKEKNGLEIVKGDILDATAVNKAVQNVDIIAHIAGHIQHRYEKHIYQVNVYGTQNIVDASMQQEKRPHILFISSENVMYPYQTMYGKSKKEAEIIIKKYEKQTILRLSVVYGKEDKINIGKIIMFIKKYPCLFIAGNGKALFQPIYVDDAAHYIIQAIKFHALLRNKVLMIAGKSQISFNSFIELIAQQLKKKIYLIHLPYALCYNAVKVLEIFWPSFPVRSSQLYNLNTPRIYDITETIKHLKYTPHTVQMGIVKLFKDD